MKHITNLLLRLVTGTELKEHKLKNTIYEPRRNNILLHKHGSVYTKYNLDTLARECKEWAWKTHQVQISSGTGSLGGWAMFENKHSFSGKGDKLLIEYEAIFMATNWLIKDKGN